MGVFFWIQQVLPAPLYLHTISAVDRPHILLARLPAPFLRRLPTSSHAQRIISHRVAHHRVAGLV